MDERKHQGPERVDIVLLHEVTQTLADKGLHVGILVRAGSLSFCHQFLDLRVDRSQSDAVLLGVDDESGETESDEDGGTCDGCPPVLPSRQQVVLFTICTMDLPRKTELGVERDETVCEPAGDTEDAVVVTDEFEV